MAYDPRGQLTSKTEAFGTNLQRATTWEYAGPFPGLVTAIEQPSTAAGSGRRTILAYDATGSLLESTIEGVEAGNAFSFTTATAHNSAGQPESIDPPGHGGDDATRFTYDPARGNLLPLSRTDPVIGATEFGYDAWNRRVSVSDTNGVETETSYDLLDRVAEIRQKGGAPAEDLVTTYEYTPLGDLARTILPRGNVIENTYDAAGRLIAVERKASPTTPGERTLYTLDGYGHHVREDLQRWNGSGWITDSTTGYRYSSRCHLDAVLNADGSETEYAYDCNGNLERIWDANHPSEDRSQPATQTYGYDALDRLTSTSQPWTGAEGGQAITRYQYDVQDHLVRVTDAEGNVTRYTYSDRDLMTRQESEVSGTTEYRYNEHGELVSETDARGVTFTRTVDAADRVTFVDYPEDSLDTRHTYDDPLVPFSKGRLTALIRGGNTVAYRYDRFGRLTQDGPLTYESDVNGNRTEIGYPGGVKVTQTFDFADRAESLTLLEPGHPAKTIASGAEYLSAGPLTSVNLGNGVTETRGFDARYFPTQILASRGASPLLDWRYTTDKIGNILSIADQAGPAQNRSYGYQDVAYFLTQGNGPWGNQSWTYDKIGNRLTETRNGSTSAYGYLPNSTSGRNPKLLEISGPARRATALLLRRRRESDLSHRGRREAPLRLQRRAPPVPDPRRPGRGSSGCHQLHLRRPQLPRDRAVHAPHRPATPDQDPGDLQLGGRPPPSLQRGIAERSRRAPRARQDH